MAKRRSASLARGQQAVRSARLTPDRDIDFSDIPESTTEELKRAKRVGRPVTGQAKQLIAIRIDPKLFDRLKKMALKQRKPYQALIHEFLEQAANRKASGF